MPDLIAHDFYHQNASPAGSITGVTIESGVSLVALVMHATTNSGEVSLTSATLGGVTATSLGNTTGSTSTKIHVLYLVNPSAGTHTFVPTMSANITLGYTLEVFQFSGASSLSAFQQSTYASSGTSPVTRQITLTDKTGLFAVVTGVSFDDNTTNASAGVPDVDFTAGYTVNNTYRQIVSGHVESVADASETYDVQFADSSMSGGTINATVVVAFIVDVAQPALTVVDTDDILVDGQQDFTATVTNVPPGEVPLGARIGSTAGVGGTELTGFSAATTGTPGTFICTMDLPSGIATGPGNVSSELTITYGVA